jgi:hypothetical protein
MVTPERHHLHPMLFTRKLGLRFLSQQSLNVETDTGRSSGLFPRSAPSHRA